MTKEEKIKKYHMEEVIYILLILATDLSNYEEEYLVGFAEDIEGRINVLFNYEFLITMEAFSNLDRKVISKMENLRDYVVKLYSSGWHHKFKSETEYVLIIRKLAKEILGDLRFDYVEPIKYSGNHLNIDW